MSLCSGLLPGSHVSAALSRSPLGAAEDTAVLCWQPPQSFPLRTTKGDSALPSAAPPRGPQSLTHHRAGSLEGTHGRPWLTTGRLEPVSPTSEAPCQAAGLWPRLGITRHRCAVASGQLRIATRGRGQRVQLRTGHRHPGPRSVYTGFSPPGDELLSSYFTCPENELRIH